MLRFFLLVTLMFAFVGMTHATTPRQEQDQNQYQGQNQNAGADSNSGGNTVSNSSKYKAAASTPATVVGNTTAACRSFIGISGMGRDGGGGLGVPIVDGDCKFMTLASAAFAQGNPDLGWSLYCRAPTVKKEIGYDHCVASALPNDPPTVVAPAVTEPSQCDEKLERCEDVAKGLK